MNLPWAANLLVACLLSSSCLANSHVSEEEHAVARSISSISWTAYCGCFDMATTSQDSELVRNCFRGFFKGTPEIKQTLKKYRKNREACFLQAKDDDEECQVVRRFELSLKFREDIKSLVTEMGNHLQATNLKVIMYIFWRNHPDIYQVCRQRVNPFAIVNKIKAQCTKTFDQLKTGDTMTNNLAAAIGEGSIGKGLKEQIMTLCYRRSEGASPAPQAYIADIRNFCDLDVLQDLVKKSKKFMDEAKIADKWSDEKLRNLYNALRLNCVAYSEYSQRARDHLQLSNNEKVNGYKNNINTIVQLVDAKDFVQLKLMTELLPNDILTCGGSQVTTTEACYFKKILDQLVTHFKFSGVRINGRKRIMLSTGTDYERLLQFRQMDRILTVVQQNQFTTVTLAEDIINSNNQRFTELKNYFVQLQSFNNNKAKADVGFIDDWIAKYRASVKKLVKENADGLTDLMKALMKGVISEVVEKLAAMALAIAEACNPLKTLFGGTSLSDIASATAEWTVAMGKLNVAKTLKSQLKTLIDKATDLGTRFGINSADITRVMNLVKSSETVDSVEFEKQKRLFIIKYGAYSPEVKRPELAEVETFWNEVVTTACDIIRGLETTTGTLVSAADIKKRGTCWKMPISIAKMMATYTEIYDFQFDLMETLASSMRAKIGKRGAENIASKFTSFPERENDNTMRYRNIYTLSYLTYNFQTWNTIDIYCDKLEYAEGGVRPRECQGERTDLPTLMSRTKRVCTGDNDEDVRIPIKAGAGDKAFLNITNLYQGEDVSFQIPSKSWLVDNKWILESEASKAIYIKKFELFLPTVTEESVTYISKSVAIGENVLNPCPDCTQYILPNVERESKFKEGYEASCEVKKECKNPYTICRSNPLPKQCHVTTRIEDPSGTLYPSVLARWKIKIDGYQSTPIPEPANQDMYLKAKITYCSPSASAKRSSTAYTRARRSRKCCEGRNYFSLAANECTPCPAESEPNLHGYYCEKNNDAIMVE